MALSPTSKYRPIAVAAAALTMLLSAAAFAADPTPDPAEPAFTGSGAMPSVAPAPGVLP